MLKFTRKAKGHFVTPIESGVHLIECISGHESTEVSWSLLNNSGHTETCTKVQVSSNLPVLGLTYDRLIKKLQTCVFTTIK